MKEKIQEIARKIANKLVAKNQDNSCSNSTMRDKIASYIYRTPLKDYINDRIEVRQKIGQVGEDRDDSHIKSKMPNLKDTDSSESAPELGSEPEEIYKEKERKKKKKLEPNLIVKLKKESLDKPEDEREQAMFQYLLELMKDNKKIDEAIELTKDAFSEKMDSNLKLTPEMDVIEEIKREGGYKIVKKNGTIICQPLL